MSEFIFVNLAMLFWTYQLCFMLTPNMDFQCSESKMISDVPHHLTSVDTYIDLVFHVTDSQVVQEGGLIEEHKSTCKSGK